MQEGRHQACKRVSKSQRNKGAGGEREIATILTNELGFEVKRTLGQARDGGHDIQIAQFKIEVKRRKSLAVYAFMDQAKEASSGSDIPIVAMRADGKEWLVMMRLEDAIPMLRDALPQR